VYAQNNLRAIIVTRIGASCCMGSLHAANAAEFFPQDVCECSCVCQCAYVRVRANSDAFADIRP